MDKKDVITNNEKFVLWHAGLRGAIAFSIALHFPDTTGLRSTVIDVTSMVILLSVFGLGGTTNKVLTWCKIQQGLTEDNHEAHVQAVTDAVNSSWLKSKLRHIDRKILQPMFVKKKMRASSVVSTAGVEVASSPEEEDATYDEEAREEAIEGAYVRGGGGGVTLLRGGKDRQSRDSASSFV